MLAQSYVSVNNMQHTLNTAGLRAILAMQGRRILMALAALALAPCVFAEDGYDLWLRYVPVQAQWLAGAPWKVW